MMSSEHLAICINSKLNSMTMTEKEDYFRKFGFELIKAPEVACKKERRKKPARATSSKKPSKGSRVFAVAMAAKHIK